MDKEKIFRNLEQRYVSKHEMTPRLPLGMDPEMIWSELLSQRKKRATILPLKNYQGISYWYVTTSRMVASSEKIIEALYEMDAENTDFDPYLSIQNLCSLEEAFYTSFVEGSSMTMQEAMAFIQSESPPRDIEEQLILNNRNAGSHAALNLYRGIDETFLKELSYILTDGLDESSQGFRLEDWVDIPSMQGEEYELPRACILPDRADELKSYLADPIIHPLIKAATAQAWVLAVRPFIDGNERLGRMLSYIILIRAGYSFFSEVSISSLIARRSYSYFEAVSNILRSENGADLTYFIEYYIELLARAVEERKLKKLMKQEQDHLAEMEMARAPLAAATPETEIPSEQTSLPADTDSGGPIDSCDKEDESDVELICTPGHENDDEELVVDADHFKDYVYELLALIIQWAEEGKQRFSAQDVMKQRMDTESKIQMGLHILENNEYIETCSRKRGKRLYTIREGITVNDAQKDIVICDPVKYLIDGLERNDPIYSGMITQIIHWVGSGKTVFQVPELMEMFGCSGSKFSGRMRNLSKWNVIDMNYIEHAKKNGGRKHYKILITKGMLNRSEIYRFIYSTEVLNTISDLRTNVKSAKDRRIGEILFECLLKGEVTLFDYKKRGLERQWNKDIRLAEQIGIVEQIDQFEQRRYRILSQIKNDTTLSTGQKVRLSELYKTFGFRTFSREMVMSTLDYSDSKASASLHEFTLMRILECKNEDVKKYRILVTPEEKPEYFDVAV